MFWDNVACVYDLFVNIVNGKTHRKLKRIVADLIETDDEVLECACGTGMLSTVIAEKCSRLTATDFSKKMLQKARRNCADYSNITFRFADITALDFSDKTFDKVVAGNIIHLLDEPLTALRELDRVCKPNGMLIVPTYMNKKEKGQTDGFVAAAGKAGADFKRHFTIESYGQFFLEAGYTDVQVTLADGRIPCAVAVVKKEAIK